MNKIKNAFSQIKVSDNIEDKILDSTVNKKIIKTGKFKMAYVFCLVAILMISFSIVYAKEIKEIFNGLIIKNVVKEKEDGSHDYTKVNFDNVIDINQDAKFVLSKCKDKIRPSGFGIMLENDECFDQYTVDELEEKLSIKLLRSDLFYKKKFYLHTLMNDDNGKYEFLNFRMVDAYRPYHIKVEGKKDVYTRKPIENEEKTPQVNMNIRIKTKYFNPDTKKTDYLFDTHTENAKKYYIKKFDITGLEIKNYNSRSIIFVYDNIYYSIQIKFPSKIENYDERIEEEINKIIDSLHY